MEITGNDKLCKHCNITKPISDFVIYRRICKSCFKPIQHDLYEKGYGLKHKKRAPKLIVISHRPVGRPRKIINDETII